MNISTPTRTITLQGWCTDEKRAATIELIVAEKPQVIVELGTFGGAWLVPAAMAAPRATCWAVDPYSAGACLENMEEEVSRKWWGNENMLRSVKAGFLGAVKELGLTNIELLEMTSEQAVGRFADGSIDLLHSDANHSYEPTMRDWKLWLPKVRVGGIIIQDDLGWREGGKETVRPVVEWAMREGGCEWIKQVSESGFLRKVK